MSLDAVILGAGPAGSAAAAELARAGAKVAIVGRLPCDGVEGLSERTVDQLGHLGVDAATVRDLAPAHRTGTWGSERRPVDGVEWLVDRSTLAEAVRSRAIALGARFVPGMVTDSVPDGELWRHRLIDGTELEARVVVDARGRRGPEVAGPRLVAIGQRRRFSAPQGERGTAIRPFQSGWAWWAWRHDELWVQITTEPRSGPVSARLREAADRLPELAHALTQTSAAGAMVARPAHARLGRDKQRRGWWAAGDRAMALDPLSGQGVYEALVGAKVVATAISAVAAGDDELLARRFVAERCAATYMRGVRTASELYGENGGLGGFWTATGAAYAALSSVQDDPRARIERRPVLDHGRIRAEDVVVTSGHPRGVWQVAGVSVAKLATCLNRDARVSIERAAFELNRPPGDIAHALRWLKEAGVVG